MKTFASRDDLRQAVLRATQAGRTLGQIADALHVSPTTIRRCIDGGDRWRKLAGNTYGRMHANLGNLTNQPIGAVISGSPLEARIFAELTAPPLFDGRFMPQTPADPLALINDEIAALDDRLADLIAIRDLMAEGTDLARRQKHIDEALRRQMGMAS